MLIIGAKGHAMEVLQCLPGTAHSQLVFFDDVTPGLPALLLGQYRVLRTGPEAQAYLASTDARFLLGLGGPALRRRLALQFAGWGGVLTTVVASTAVVGPHVAALGAGSNVMHHTLVAPSAALGEGVLLNAGASVHHDAVVGDYVEISPGARLLGRCRVGSGSQIGAGAVVLPDIVVGRNAVIGAGAVVTRAVADGAVVAGVPARPLPGRTR